MSAGVSQFQDFELDPRAYQLRRNGAIVRLERIPLELLCLLVDRAGQLVGREEILERIWGKGVFIDGEHSINTAIRKIRRALNDDAEAPRFVVTIPAKGYRFVASVHVPNDEIPNGELNTNQEAGQLALPVKVPARPHGDTAKSRRAGLLSAAALLLIAGAFALIRYAWFQPPAQSAPSASSVSREKLAVPRLPDMPKIAVLPFTNLGENAQQQYFSDGITDELITGLSRLPVLFVIARDSSFAYKGKTLKEAVLGRELGAQYLLEGTVARTADRVRISTHLVYAATGTEVWAQSYDRPLQDLAAVQVEIVDGVVTTLGLIFRLRAMKVPHLGNALLSKNTEAFDAFLRAVEYSWLMTKDDNARARQWAEKAILLDPTFAEAYAHLGWDYSRAVDLQFSQHPDVDLKTSSELALKALALDEGNFDALGLLSRNDLLQSRFDLAIANARRAIELNPNFALGYFLLGQALIFAGRPEEGLRATQRAMRLDPAASDFYGLNVGFAYLVTNRSTEAIPVLKRYVSLLPADLYAHLWLAIAYTELGRKTEARAEAAEVVRNNPRGFLLPANPALAKRWKIDLQIAGIQ
jgi:TolB-like protein/DNA-binding winged helix-turn-helix (wHTH) protein/cytochrome c-type biogenesis protein CcmH/NrfG